MPLQPTIAYVTDIHGNVCQVSGQPELLCRIIKLLEQHGFAYNAVVQCYDEGFYASDTEEPTP